MSGTRSSWRPVSSAIPQRLMLFNIFINVLDNGTEDANQGGVVDRPVSQK